MENALPKRAADKFTNLSEFLQKGRANSDGANVAHPPLCTVPQSCLFFACALSIPRMGLVRIICFVYRNFQAILLSFRIYFLGTLFICHSGRDSPSCTIKGHKLSDFLFFLSISRMPGSICNPIIFISIIFSCVRFLFPLLLSPSFCLGLFVVCFSLDLFATLTLLSFDYGLHYLHATLTTTTIRRATAAVAAAASAVSRRFRICLPYKYCRINMPACSLSLAYDMNF